MSEKNFVATTKDWLKATEGVNITAYDPPSSTQLDSQIIEPDQAVNLSAADRAKMNRVVLGTRTKPERL